LQQSTPSWRAFDTPTGDGAAAPRPGDPGSSGGSPGLAQPNVLLAIAALVGALLIGGVALVVAIGGSTGATIEAPGTAAGPFGSPETSAGGAGQILVDVAGAVVNPGLHRLAAGARVGDAIDAAGGFSPRVDAERVASELNLAATLADGDQVRVPSRDEPADGSGGPGAAGGGSEPGGLVDLNTATQAELEELPGIGPVTAQKIIAARSEAPFRSVQELRERGLVGEKTFEQLKTLVAAG
jgi:competence protein ComEA